jgi:hypothetical protein
VGSRSVAWRPVARDWRAAHQAPPTPLPEGRVDLPKAVGEDHCGQDAPQIRHELVECIRQSVATGDYLTSEKIDVTVDCICRELLSH